MLLWSTLFSFRRDVMKKEREGGVGGGRCRLGALLYSIDAQSFIQSWTSSCINNSFYLCWEMQLIFLLPYFFLSWQNVLANDWPGFGSVSKYHFTSIDKMTFMALHRDILSNMLVFALRIWKTPHVALLQRRYSFQVVVATNYYGC